MDQLNFPWSIFFGSIILRILRHCYVLTMACRNEDLFQLWVSRHCSQFCCPLNFHPQPIFLSNKIAELEVEWTCHWRSRRLSCTARCLVGPRQQLGSGNRGFPTNSHWGKGWPDMGFRGTLPAFDGRNPSIFNWSIHVTMGLIHQHGWPSNFVIFPYIFPMNLLFSTMFFMFSSLFREIRDHFPCLWFLPYDIWSIFCNLTVSCGNKTTLFQHQVEEDSDTESEASPSPSTRGFQRRLRCHSSPPGLGGWDSRHGKHTKNYGNHHFQ